MKPFVFLVTFTYDFGPVNINRIIADRVYRSVG